jgi:hypothetical protein
MEGLSKDILKHIGKFLRPEDLNAFGKTNKLYRKVFSKTSLPMNADRIFLYAQRALCEDRNDAFHYFCHTLSTNTKLTHGGKKIREFYLRIIELDKASALSIFKRYFFQEFNWMFELQLWASRAYGSVWGLVVLSINTFEQLSNAFLCLHNDSYSHLCPKVDVEEKLKILYLFTNIHFFEWAISNEECAIALVIINELQFEKGFDFTCNRKFSEEMQKLYVNYYDREVDLDDERETSNLLNFIRTIGRHHVHADVCSILTYNKLHHLIEEWCNCKQVPINLVDRKRLLKFRYRESEKKIKL